MYLDLNFFCQMERYNCAEQMEWKAFQACKKSNRLLWHTSSQQSYSCDYMWHILQITF